HPIDRHVHDDAINPGVKGRLTAEASNRLPCLEEALLSEIPCVLFAMDHVVNHAEYSCPVAGYQLVECFGVTVLASFYQVQFRHIGLRQSRFRLHDWTERALISFNAENCLGRSDGATQRDIRPLGIRCRRGLQRVVAARPDTPTGLSVRRPFAVALLHSSTS